MGDRGWLRVGALGVAVVVFVASAGSIPAHASTHTSDNVRVAAHAAGVSHDPVRHGPIADAGITVVRQDQEPWQITARVRLLVPGATGSARATSPGAILKLNVQTERTVIRTQPIGIPGAGSPPEIAEMRTCVVTRETNGSMSGLPPATCDLPDQWEPYTMSRDLAVEVDWIGSGEVTVLTQFRRADGVLVPSSGTGGPPTEYARATLVLNSTIDPNIPIESLSPAAQALINAQLVAFPVSGSVKIQGSPCCIGGTTGGTVTAQLAFAASSPHGEVTEMRIGTGGCTTGQLGASSSDWEPFATGREVAVPLSSGWSTYAVAVQFRDAAGNLSAVACDSIGVEGMRPR